jgi:lactoylglutathione lyase
VWEAANVPLQNLQTSRCETCKRPAAETYLTRLVRDLRIQIDHPAYPGRIAPHCAVVVKCAVSSRIWLHERDSELLERTRVYRTAGWDTSGGTGVEAPQECENAVMPSYLHTMVRITDPDKSRAFYEALGMEFRREMDIVRDGEREATNYFLGFPGDDAELELTLNHDGRSYDLGSGYGHIAIGVEDLDGTLARLAEQGIEPERAPYRVREGGSRLCFVKDPDSYRVEIIERAA